MTPPMPMEKKEPEEPSYQYCWAMSTAERWARLHEVFEALRKDGSGLTLAQEDAVRAAMGVRRAAP